jgi:ABC-type nickel/cobalt efflux system permease component RcnA
MNHTPQLLLIGTVAAIGVLHTMVPDHWMPIILLARQHGWSRRETALAALQAGLGHVLSTLLIALAVALAGVAFAARFGHLVDSAASLALIGLGGWIAIGALRELREHSGNQPGDLPHPHPHGPRHLAAAHLEAYDDDPPMRDRLYMPLARGLALAGSHVHFHRHDSVTAHLHWHDHDPRTFHALSPATDSEPLHDHRHRTPARTAMLLILGSSPMVEGIPAFFAAAKYGAGLLLAMAVVFGLSTIATYILVCVYSAAGLQRIRLGAAERYGEVLSGALVALIGLIFLLFPIL